MILVGLLSGDLWQASECKNLKAREKSRYDICIYIICIYSISKHLADKTMKTNGLPRDIM